MLLDSEDQAVFFGDTGSVEFLAEQLARLKCNRIFCVTGKDSYSASGADTLLRNVLRNRERFRFSEFSANPEFLDLKAGLKHFRSFNPDCIIGIGGGSVLDMAKLIRFFGSSGMGLEEWFDETPAEQSTETLPMVAVPTTAGAGSEATAFAVLYRDGKKYSVAHGSMLPDVAVLNPKLTESLSPYQTACSGFDAFAQAIESYWAVGSTETSRKYSAEAIELCMAHLEDAVLDPVAVHREGLMKAAYLAGRAINTAKTTAAHALSYALTALYGLPHGHAVAMMLPWVFALNAGVASLNVADPRGIEYVKDRMEELCGMLGQGSAESTVCFLQEMCVRIGLNRNWIKDLGVGVEEMQACIVNGVNEKRAGNNPRRLNAENLQWVASHT